MDHYQVLGVSFNATEEEIKKAYRQGAKQYHPDRNPGDKEAENNFKKVQLAYDTLIDNTKRAEYDHSKPFRYEHKTKNTDEFYTTSASRKYKANQDELDKIQCQFFGNGNVLVHLPVSTIELREGTVKTVRWKKRDKCKLCDGYGAAVFTESEFIKCQACAGTGNILKIPGKLNPKCDFCSGNGFLEMFCKNCSGTGLTKDIVVEEMLLEIPMMTPSGNQIIVRGRGEPGVKGGLTGNLHVIVIEQSSQDLLKT